MRIWIDADAAPREVKELVFRISQRRSILVTLVANQTIAFPKNALINCVTVRQGANVADKYMIEHVSAGDIAVTADVPLAAALVAAGARVIDPRGDVIDERSAASRLAVRDLFDAARGAGMQLAGPKPYSDKDRILFANTLDREVTRALKLSQEP